MSIGRAITTLEGLSAHDLEIVLAHGRRLLAERASAAAPLDRTQRRRAFSAARQRRRRERCGGDVPRAQRLLILKRDSFTCAYCGERGTASSLHIDHVFPVALGGKNDPANLRAACGDCNRRKGARVLAPVGGA